MSKRTAEDDGLCSFFLEKKKRHCRMAKTDGMRFCPHHSHLGVDIDPRKGTRVPCPLDPSHFCYERKLEKHLKKCNARDKCDQEYYVENVNAGEATGTFYTKLNLQDVSNAEIYKLIGKVRMKCKELLQEIPETTTFHPVLKSEMENSEDKLNNFKHMKQQATLLSVMEKNSLLENGTCFIEFGAGKGQLMYWIIKCVPETAKKAFILIDKSAQRHKVDNKFKDSDILIKRFRIDIQHLFLGKVPNIENKLDKVVGVSKHLCGGATDLALRCLINTLNNDNVKHNVFGLLMALCCHHRCSWDSYVGRDFMENHGFSDKDFRLMCCMASWATCGIRKNRTENVDSETSNHVQDIPDENLLDRYQKLDLTPEERELIGFQCKRLIDTGRVYFLKNQGFESKLIRYTDKSVSLENVALLATCKTF